MAKGTVERSLENIFDGLFSRAFKSGVKPLQLGRKLLQVVDSERDVDAQGRRVVPNSYLIQLSPEDREGFADVEPTLLQELTVALREYISQEGYHVEGKARVALRTNPDLRRGKFDIDCRNITPDAAPAQPSAPAAPSTEPTIEVSAAPLLTAVPSAFDRPPAVLSLPNGQRIELHEGHYVLGRHLENDIVLNDTNVSRKHAEFVCAAGEVVVRDLGSTNGTKVNGVLITGEQLLQHGDVINFGTAQVRFEAS
jgi:pSer/pThr/pTyr-binding forkhead associated (FHA) protein